MVIFCAGVLAMYAWRIGHYYALITANGPEDIGMKSYGEAFRFAVRVQGDFCMNLAVVGGFVGWILGIVATVKSKGRAAGIAAIVLGVVAPIIAVLLVVPGYFL